MTLNLPQQTKVYHTSKLFRDKYKYRVCLYKAPRYRFKNWKDELKSDPLPVERFNSLPKESKKFHRIYNLLRGKDVYITLSYYGPQILTNDETLVEALVNEWPSSYLWEPKPGSNLVPGAVIYKRKIPFKYRVTLEFPWNESRDYSEFVDWSEGSNGQIQISSWSRKTLRRVRRWRSPIVIYAKNENTLSILHLMIGGNIKKVETIQFTETA